MRPPPLTAIVVLPALPSLDTSATSSDPGGGVNGAVTMVVAAVVDATAGVDASSVSVPAVRISAIASGPVVVPADVAPRVVAPGVPVSDVALNVTYSSEFVASATSSTTVVSAAAVAALFTDHSMAP